MHRVSQIFGWSLIWSGFFIFGYLGWQLWGTDVVNAGVQANAVAELEVTIAEEQEALPDPAVFDPSDLVDPADPVDPPDPTVQPDPSDPSPNVPRTVSYQAQDAPEAGTAFAMLRIPAIGVEEAVFEGVDVATLKNGPGHMPGTSLPGHPGNSVLSGHRTTYGRPFFDLDLLEVGDVIEVESAVGTHVYEVREIFVVLPTDFWVTYDKSGGWLTLTTCNPRFSARERLIVWAEMVSGPNYDYSSLHQAAVDQVGA